MKKIFLLLPVLVYASSYGQLQNTTAPTDVFMHYRVSSKNGKQLSYEEVKGSPYLVKDFRSAKIADGYEMVLARYNAYTDEVEFKKGDGVYVLPKNKDFSQINFLNSKDNLILISNGDDSSGYYFKITGDKNSLLKKEKVVFNDVVPSASSYESEKPAKFLSQKPIYYFKTDKGVVKKILNNNDIYDLFPDKKQSVNKFIKEKRIKINQENDLIELVNYLNSI
ncbi:hypothetical protein [Chryseobacterium terrae]|uniref:GLPGLI family protein n=1 Tax=Chryseobacterium terrae TaxID=3163299 RepID=A0ABW8Y5H4_9FLAO